MQRTYQRWFSPHLGRDMEMLVFGHAGTPILVFPTSLGRFFEWEDFGMVEALSEQLENGWNMMFCVDGIDRETFYNKALHPAARMLRYNQYQQYIMEEVLPFIHHTSGNEFIIVTGASFGAYHAATFMFKYPWNFGKLISLSGTFDIKPWLDGYYDDNVYFNNPVDFLPNLNDPHILDRMRQNHYILYAGEYDPCLPDNQHMSQILASKDIHHTVDIWPGVFGHDWPWWRVVIRRHIA